MKQTALWSRTAHFSHPKLPLKRQNTGKYDVTDRSVVCVDNGNIHIFLRTKDHQKHNANSAFAFANSAEGHVSPSAQPSPRPVEKVQLTCSFGALSHHIAAARTPFGHVHNVDNLTRAQPKLLKNEELGPCLNTLCNTKLPRMGLQELQ